MKKLKKFLLGLFVFSCFASYAYAKDITVNFTINDNDTVIIPETARFNIFTKDGVWLENDCIEILHNTKNASVTFSVPDEESSFTLTPTVGISELTYNRKSYKLGDKIEITPNEENIVSANITPLFIPPTGLKTDTLTLYFDVLNKGTPIEADARFNIFDENGEWLANDAVHVTNGGERLELNFKLPPYYTGTKFKLTPTIGMTSIDYNGTEYKTEETIELETYAYENENKEIVVGNFFHFNLTPLNKYPERILDHKFREAATEFVNASGIDSKTNYLIWVSKKDYTVSVFLGKAGEWEFVNAFDCAIGAPNTPTITGAFEYFQHQERWNYDTYYVGPIMRFAPKGYALHSTLIRYNGQNADARLRMKISHGCVRLAPPSINWLVEYIPLNTRVYVTE